MNKVFTRRIGDTLEARITNLSTRLNQELIFRTMRNLGFDLDKSKTYPGSKYFVIAHTYQVDVIVETGFKSFWHSLAFWLPREERVNTKTYRKNVLFPEGHVLDSRLNAVFVSSSAQGAFPTFPRGTQLVWEESIAL